MSWLPKAISTIKRSDDNGAARQSAKGWRQFNQKPPAKTPKITTHYLLTTTH